MSTDSLPISLPPLCVDLDGTLVRSDTLVESVLSVVRPAPQRLFGLVAALKRGKARFKAYVAERSGMEVDTLPYQAAFLAFLQEQKAAGRKLVLVTAAHRTVADQVAQHLGLFDVVMASDEGCNLKAKAKRDRLVAEFGEGGFDYAGNSHADLPVWAACRKAIVVNPDPGVERAARNVAQVEQVFCDRPRGPGPYLRAMRLHHWAKNLLVFVPLIAAHRIWDMTAFGQLIIAFLAFGFTASSVYLLNDLLDLTADRHHPVKKHRQLAAGNLSIVHACLLIPLLLLAALLISALLPSRFTGLLLVYYLCTLAYSMGLKRVMMVDVLMLAWLYVIRVLAGTAAVHITLSFWLFAFAMFVFLSIAMVKRHAELCRFKSLNQNVPKGRGYRIEDLGVLSDLGTASGFMAVLVLALYLNSPDVRALYDRPEWLWSLCPLMIYWISRVWILAGRGELEDDPLLFALTDKTSYLVGALGLAVVLYAT